MPTAPAGRPGPPPDGERTLTILVVERDAAVAALLRTLLNDVPGWGATVVHDAAAARAVASHLKVEVVVVDFHLAGISGLELLDLWPADPGAARPSAVLTTSAPPPPAVRAAIARGLVAAVVRKPFDVDELVAAVRQVAEARYGTA